MQRVFQEGILEPKVLFDARTPTRLPIKVNISPLLVFVRGDLGFFVPLEPGHVLFVKPPGLFLEFSCRQVLLVGPLLVVKDVKEGIRSELFENRRILENGVGRGRVRRGCAGIGILWSVRIGPRSRSVVLVGGRKGRVGFL